jgi:hypothetical protein
MFRRSPTTAVPSSHEAPERKLPQRWAIIIFIATAAGLLAAAAAGPAGGVTAAAITVGVLHAALE